MLRRLSRGAVKFLRAAVPYLAFLVALAGFANFFSLLGDFNQFGGSALNGFVRDGHYFVANHGTYTEVSREAWERVRLHELSVWLSFPLAIVSWGYLVLGHFIPFFMGLRQGEAVEERVRAVRASGTLLASGRCGGSVYGMNFSAPLLTVEVFPGGLTFRPFPRRPAAILRAELRRVQGTSGRWGRRVEINHTSPDIGSPIVLNDTPLGELAAALDKLAAGPEPRS